MPKLLLSVIILCLINSGCVIPTYIEKSTLKETEVIKSDAKITSLLMVGVGSTASRLFLENLSVEIVKLFARSHIKCDFTYAGKIPRHTHIDLSEIITSQYDAYLLLNPIDTSFINAHKGKAIIISPLPGGYSASGSVIGNQYKENYYVELYTNNKSFNKVWQAELNVDFDVAYPDRYRKIAKDIFNKLLKNNYIPNK